MEPEYEQRGPETMSSPWGLIATAGVHTQEDSFYIFTTQSLLYVYILSYLPNPPARAGYDTWSIFFLSGV